MRSCLQAQGIACAREGARTTEALTIEKNISKSWLLRRHGEEVAFQFSKKRGGYGTYILSSSLRSLEFYTATIAFYLYKVFSKLVIPAFTAYNVVS